MKFDYSEYEYVFKYYLEHVKDHFDKLPEDTREEHIECMSRLLKQDADEIRECTTEL